MANKREIRLSYVYRVDFEDGSWYWGVRLCPPGFKPEEDAYAGSPITHKEKWKERFMKTVVKEFDDYAEAGRYELELIKKDWHNDLCLNENCGGIISRSSCSKGGQKSAEKTKGVPRPLEVRKKISKAKKGKKLSEEQKEKLRVAKRPPRTADQVKKQMESRRNSGNPWHSQETREKISLANLGRKVSKESRTKISDSLKSKSRKWYNNGELEILSDSCPSGWKPGRVSKSKIKREK
jgi:hypothetical protein